MSQNETLNPENKCAHLYNQKVERLQKSLAEIFDMQASLQKDLAARGKSINYTVEKFDVCIRDITIQWRNLTLEFAELMERLPYKEWKTYQDDAKEGFVSEEHKLEVWYEYADMFHFFINMGLALGINGDTLEKLYVTKNKENFDRQKRGY